MSLDWMRGWRPRRLLGAVVAVTTLVPPASGWSSTLDSPGNGTISLLVKSRVPLTEEVATSIGSHAARVTYVWPEIDAMAVLVSPSRVSDLASDPLVALVEADQQGHVPGLQPEGDLGLIDSVMVAPHDSTAAIQTWNLDMVDSAGTGYDGTGVTVAVIDSGLPQNWEEFLPPDSVDLTHAAGFGAEGWGDPHSQVRAIHGAGGHIGLNPHGLSVASVITGFPSDLGPIGGVAPGARILPIRVLSQFDFGWFSWFTAGILHVGHLKADGEIPGPVVINFSIQAAGSSTVLTSAIDYAISQGVIFVTIAGNFGPSTGSISYPGRLPQAITAGAAGWIGEGCLPPMCSSPWFFADVPGNDPAQIYVASFSGRESSSPPSPTAIDVLAPGSFVFGEWLFGPGFSEGREVAFDAVSNFVFGTSFAAPHTAGIVAQMLEKNPGLRQAEVEAILRSTALAIAPDADGAVTGLQSVAPWGANATGSGLARASAALAGTPAP